MPQVVCSLIALFVNSAQYAAAAEISSKAYTTKMVTRVVFRNFLAFWIAGVCNKFGFVIMLSAAEDIISRQNHKHKENSTDVCLPDISDRTCTTRASTGAVLMADILPTLIIKLILPFFMMRIPYGFRHAVVIGFQISSYLVVAFSTSYAMSLLGVVLAACGAGVGELIFLSLSSHFPTYTLYAWASGTGAAGVVGALAYAALTEPHLLSLSAKDALLVMLVIPGIFSAAYWIILDSPKTVYTPGWNPKTWIAPVNYESELNGASVVLTTAEKGSEQPINMDGRVPQRKTTFAEKLTLIRPLLKFMIPLGLVYFAEYLINQGLTQLIYFDCSHGFSLSKKSQYRWYQLHYEIGVFLSRTSINLFELPMFVLYLFPFVQFANVIFFLSVSMYAFVPHIGIMFALIFIEGLFGGASYVNTFNYIHRKVEPDVKEFSLAIAAVGDAIGIVSAALVAIKVHNSICNFLD